MVPDEVSAREETAHYGAAFKALYTCKGAFIVFFSIGFLQENSL